MATKQREVQIAHERFTVKTFIETINHRHRASYRVIEEPTKTDAIIQSHKRKSWVEVTAAYMNRAFAEEEWSFATGKNDQSTISGVVITEPDFNFSDNFVKVVKQKLEKKSYESLKNDYGQGYLVVYVHYPFFSKRTIATMRAEWQKVAIADRGCFRSIYLVIRQTYGYRVMLWQKE